MDSQDKLRRELAEMKKDLFAKGILDDHFLRLESIEEEIPFFVEKTIVLYFIVSKSYLNEIKDALDTKPFDHGNVLHLILKLIGGSGCIGATRMFALARKMLAVFQSRNFDGLFAAYMDVKSGLATLKIQLKPYVKLLSKLREELQKVVAPDEGSTNMVGGYAESVDSNEVFDDDEVTSAES